MSRLAELNRPDLLFVVPSVLSAGECTAQIARMEAAAPSLTTDGTPRGTVRHNARVVVYDDVLAKRVFDAVREHVPSRLVGMEPVGANECLRYYRYQAGDYFKPHQDTDFQRSPKERSLLTVVVYLNGGYAGGEVAFPKIERVIAPEAGMAVVFGHRMLHESRLLVEGTKYAFRTDVMYRAVEP